MITLQLLMRFSSRSARPETASQHFSCIYHKITDYFSLDSDRPFLDIITFYGKRNRLRSESDFDHLYTDLMKFRPNAVKSMSSIKCFLDLLSHLKLLRSISTKCRKIYVYQGFSRFAFTFETPPQHSFEPEAAHLINNTMY